MRNRLLGCVLALWLPWVVTNCAAPDEGNGIDAGAGGAGGVPNTAGAGGAGGVPNTAAGGVWGSGGTAATSTDNPNVHECPGVYKLPLPAKICISCDPLPAGSTEGCPPPLNCSDVDNSSALRYPEDCFVVFPWQNQYWPDSLQAGSCGTDSRWDCWL